MGSSTMIRCVNVEKSSARALEADTTINFSSGLSSS